MSQDRRSVYYIRYMEAHRGSVGVSWFEQSAKGDSGRKTEIVEVSDEQSLTQDVIELGMENALARICASDLVGPLAVAFARWN